VAATVPIPSIDAGREALRFYDFNFSGTSVGTACYTNDRPDSITVEVNGVRSNTITA
jgi:hypothetical protein